MYRKIALTFLAFLTVHSLSTTSSILAQSDDMDQSESAAETNISMDLTSIIPVVSMIKGQIKEIVLDLALQVFQYIRAIAQECKVRLLKRLGKHTLSDVFHLVFDGVVEFVNEDSPVTSSNESTAVSTEKSTPSTVTEDSKEDVFQSEYNDLRRRYNESPYSWSLYHK